MPTPNRNNSIKSNTLGYTSVNTRTGAQTGSGSLGEHEIFRDVETTSSVQTPNFSTLRRFGNMLPVNNYSHHKQRINDPKTVFSTRSKPLAGGDETLWTYNTNIRAFGGTEYVPSDFAVDDPAPKVILKILDEISQGKAQSAVTAAEMGKTARHVAETATRLAGALGALRKGRLGDMATHLGVTTSKTQRRNFYTGMTTASARDGVSNQRFKYQKKFTASDSKSESSATDFAAKTWLEYSYAWKPMLSDVYSHAEAAANAMIEKSGMLRFVSAKSHCVASHRTLVRPVNDQMYHEKTCEQRLSVRIGLYYRIPPGSMNLAYAFGLTDPLSVAWELVPFSFVADWFLPVGDAIRALQGYNGLVFASGFKTFKHERLYKFAMYGAGESILGGNTRWYGQSGRIELTNEEYRQGRTALSEFPAFGWPKPKDPRSWSHAISAISLLQNLFLSRSARSSTNRF